MSRTVLAEAEKLLGALLATLADERAAVVKLDPAALDRARADKERITETLTGLDPFSVSNDLDHRRVEAVRGLAARVVNTARANAILLVDAAELIATRAGIERAPSPTYDARARLRAPARRLVAQGA
jgi:hypothetical protein